MLKLFQKNPLARWQAAGWPGAAGLFEALSLAAFFAFFLSKTWYRWPEPLIDFPRYLYIPWRMSHGALLYQDVVSNYGPLPNLVEAAGFRLFGPGLDVLVGLNLTITVAVLLLLYGIFRAVGDRLSAWLGAVVFLAVFALPLYSDSTRSIYNFITPYSSQATYGFAGCLLTVYALLRHASGGRRWWFSFAGGGLAVAFLCKPELLLAALGTLVCYFMLQAVKIWRDRDPDSYPGAKIAALLWMVRWSLVGFFIVYLPVLLILVRAGGWAYAIRAANWTLRVFYDPAYRQAGGTHFQEVMMGFDHPGANLLRHLAWGALLMVFCAALAWAGWRWRKDSASGRTAQGILVFVLAAVFLAALLVDWREIGVALLLPTALVALLAIGASFWNAWRGRPVNQSFLKLAVLATAALLLLARMLLNVRIDNYGFTLGVLAALLLVHVLVYELPTHLGVPGQPNRLLQIAFALLILTGAAQLCRESLANYANRTFAVGSGRDQFYAYPPNISGDGAILNIITEAMHKYLGNAKSVVAFPETQAINYALRLPNPIPDLQFNPDVLDMAGPAQVLAKLQAHPPDAIVLYARDLHEYNVPYFGADVNSGSDILGWIKEDYRPIFAYGKTTFSATGHDIDVYVRRDLAPGLPLTR